MSAEQAERDVVVPLEEAVYAVNGVRSIASTVRDGDASITLELEPASDNDKVLSDVREKVEQTRARLPREAPNPELSLRLLDDRPVVWVSVSGLAPTAELSDYARSHIRKKLETLPGVSEVVERGLPERASRLRVDVRRLDALGVTVLDVFDALERRRHHRVDVSGRRVSRRSTEMLPLREFSDPKELLNTEVIKTNEGSPVLVSDVAVFEAGLEEMKPGEGERPLFRGLGVKRQVGVGAPEIIERVRRAVTELTQDSPPGLQLDVRVEEPSEEYGARWKRLEFSVRGSDWDALVNAAKELPQKLESSGKVGKVETDYRAGSPEQAIDVDRKLAAEQGVAVESLTTTFSVWSGILVAEHNINGHRVFVSLHIEPRSMQELLLLKVRAESGKLLPISSMVRLREQPPPETFTRRDRERAITFSTHLVPGVGPKALIAEIKRLGSELPSWIHVEIHQPPNGAFLRY